MSRVLLSVERDGKIERLCRHHRWRDAGHVSRVQKISLLPSDVAPLNTSIVPAAHVKVSAPWFALSKAGVACELRCGDDIAIPALIVRTELELHAVYK